MSDKLKRQPIAQGVHFSGVRDPKFKHNRLTVNFIMPLSAKTASDYAAVPCILCTGCRELPDLSSLNARLCELYGASLHGEVTKSSGWQILEVSIKAMDNRFALEGEDVTAQCAQLLASVLLDPKLDQNGLFYEQDTALQRQYVLDSIEAEVNDKRTYALSRCVQEMCKGEPVAVHRLGDKETAERITTRSATDAYRKILEIAQVEIQFTGSGDPSAAMEVFRQRFAGLKRNPIDYQRTGLRTTSDNVREHIETMDVSQSKLVMGLRTGPGDGAEISNARRVLTAMLGGTPFSKLFMNVREKLSLCYYCTARYDNATGLLLVDSGVEAKNKQKALEEIMAQLACVQRGEFEADELANTKLLMKNSIITAKDTLFGLENWYLAQILLGQNFSPEEDAENIDKITREQIIDAANSITLDTVYFLTGTGKGDGIVDE